MAGDDIVEELTRKSTLYCQVCAAHDGGTYLAHFMPHPEVTRLYNTAGAVYTATVEQIEEPPEPRGEWKCYWGWWSNKDQRFSHVYNFRGAVEMCFPYGSRVEEEKGKGHLVPVSVTLGDEIPREKRKS